MRLPLLAASAILLAACSGSISQTAHGTDGGGGDAGEDVVSHPDSGGSSGSSGSSGGGSGGGTCRSEPPTLHRPSASACASHETDAGVDSGLVGPCNPPHDACLVDSDCGSTGVCDCEAPRCTEPFGVAGNVCVTSDCHVDSDCACGFCAADTWCGGIQSYHCTTPHDECSTDADCQGSGSFTQCSWSTDHWACVAGMACPG